MLVLGVWRFLMSEVPLYPPFSTFLESGNDTPLAAGDYSTGIPHRKKSPPRTPIGP